jgi:predicted acylesterase/phospholipase RssA
LVKVVATLRPEDVMEATLTLDQSISKSRTGQRLNVVVLQGGGALGSYQAGVFAALEAQGISLGWAAGVSIGAVNAAIIAGNPRERRLRDFWETITKASPWRRMCPTRSGARCTVRARRLPPSCSARLLPSARGARMVGEATTGQLL